MGKKKRKPKVKLKAKQRAFEGAQHSPQHLARPIGSQQSPDASVEQAGTSLRQWGRYLDENHDIAIGILDELVTNVVGTGLHVEPTPTVNGRVSQDLADRVRDAWEMWAREPEVTRELPWLELQRLACRAWLRDGEVFAQHVGADAAYTWRTTDVRYKVEHLDADMVPIDFFVSQDPRWRQGVLLNEWNEPLIYAVYLRNPYDYTASGITSGAAGDSTRTKTVPAERMLHIKFMRRWPQTRGVPITHGIIRRLQDLKDYEDSERIAARVAASMCAFIRRSPDNNYETKDDAFDNRPSRMQSGRIFDDLMPGEDVGTIDTNRPSSELGEFRKQMIRALASGTGARYSSIANDYSGTYSSQRQELVESRPHYLRLRHYFVERYVRPIYERWFTQAWAQGVFGNIPASAPLVDLLKAEIVGPGQAWIEPLKEVQADVMAIENGLVTREQVIRMRGGDPRQVPAPEPREPAQLTLLDTDDDDDDSASSGA